MLKTHPVNRRHSDMRAYQDGWSSAAAFLGVELVGPTEIKLPSGSAVRADMVVVGFGAPKGTLVFSDLKIVDKQEEIIDGGYSYSVFDFPQEGYKITTKDLMNILKDWGWYGSANDKPQWL